MLAEARVWGDAGPTGAPLIISEVFKDTRGSAAFHDDPLLEPGAVGVVTRASQSRHIGVHVRASGGRTSA